VRAMRFFSSFLFVFAATAVMTGCGGGGAETSDGRIGSGSASVTVSWTAPTDSRVAGYRVYVGTASGNYLQGRGSGLNASSNTSKVVSGLVSGQTYYFVVTTYDASDDESVYSNEVSATIQ
jgi:hypothetical protein